MPGADDGNETPLTPRTKGIIQHFERKVKLHTEGLDNDLQVTNEKLGQLEATQIATNNKLTSLEESVASVDKSLAALLRRFDAFHTEDKEKHKEEKEGDREHGSHEDDYTGDTEHDDQDTRDRRRLRHNRRGMGGNRHARYTIMMMLSVRLNLRYPLLMVNMTLMLTSLGRLLLIKSLHVMNFLRLHVLGLLLVSLQILLLFGG